MSIDIKQLEINVNLHSLQPGFLNAELHYIIAASENTFRFAKWDEEPEKGEQKFYCFLMEQELFIPAGSIVLKECYVLKKEPLYPLASDYTDFVSAIETLPKTGVAKCIRRFSDHDIDTIKNNLEEKYGPVEKHIVTSFQGQHLLLVLNDIEISISATMIYFRNKTQFSDNHYHSVKE